MTTPDPDDVYYLDMNGGVHFTPQEAIAANLQIEQANGQYVTSGNCGQDPDNVPAKKEDKKDDKKK